jgi:hypothetical protein
VTDIRARLAEAVREHQLGFDHDKKIWLCVSMSCNWTGHNLDFEEHQADVLLSLPGIAIVEIPHGDGISPDGAKRFAAAALLAEVQAREEQ